MKSRIRYIFTNMLRRPLRSLVTAGGVAVAVAAVYCLISFQRGYEIGLRQDMDKLGAHLLVVPKGCPYDAASIALHGASWPCYLKSSYLETVKNTPHVATAAPVLMNAMFLPSGQQAVYCGVMPNILAVKRGWQIAGRFPSQPGDLLVGSEEAKENNWRLGQSVQLPGIANATGTVSGIIATTDGADDLFIYLSLADAQKLFNRPGQLTHILVRLDRPENMDNVVINLRGCDAGLEMNVVPLAHLFRTIQSLIQSTRLLLFCVALVAVLASGSGVANTVMMVVAERTREIGVLRAIGVTQQGVFAMIWGELALLCGAGAAAGIVISLLSAHALDAWLRGSLPFAPHRLFITPALDLAACCVVGAVAIGTLASLIPLIRAARMSPTVALRAVGGEA